MDNKELGAYLLMALENPNNEIDKTTLPEHFEDHLTPAHDFQAVDTDDSSKPDKVLSIKTDQVKHIISEMSEKIKDETEKMQRLEYLYQRLIEIDIERETIDDAIANISGQISENLSENSPVTQPRIQDPNLENHSDESQVIKVIDKMKVTDTLLKCLGKYLPETDKINSHDLIRKITSNPLSPEAVSSIEKLQEELLILDFERELIEDEIKSLCEI